MGNKYEKRGGLEPIATVCLDLMHEPPKFLYIPPGKQYRHICPSCGFESVIRGNQVRWGNEQAR